MMSDHFARFLTVLIVVLALNSCPRAAPVGAQDGVPVGPVATGTRPDRKTPTHFILNPDVSRPADYPAEISLKEAQAFLKTQNVQGQGCGGMTWENKFCGMFLNSYGTVQTPWLNVATGFNATFAQTKEGNFLTGVTIGRNGYTRADRTVDKLIWHANHRHVDEQADVRDILYGDDSAKRKQLLTKIAVSFEGLDLNAFPAKARESLRMQIDRCRSDSDPEVAALAERLTNQLSQSLDP